MFGNAAAYSQQIGVQAGIADGSATPPTFPSVSMTDPRSVFTGQVAPGAFGAEAGQHLIGAGQAGLGVAGMGLGFLGMAGKTGMNWGTPIMGHSLLDPITTVGKSITQGFWRGAGVTGAQIATLGGGGGGLLSTIGAVPSLGGRAIAGGLAGGIGAGLLAAAPYAAIGAAVDYAGNQMMTGAQQFSSTQAMFGGVQRSMMPGMVGPGAMGFNQGDIGGITNMMRGMGGGGVDFNDLQGTMGSLIGGGHFRMTQSVKDFRNKFKETVETLKEISQIFHTSLQEAVPLLEQHKQMGMYTSGAIRSGIQSNRLTAMSAGISSQGMMSMMQGGAQIGRAFGATGARGVGAMRGAVGMIGAGQQMGLFSEEQISEATGGLLGEEAVAALSQSVMGAAYRSVSSRLGYKTMGALMNEQGTGLDPEAMQSYLSGSMSKADMLKRFKSRTKTRRGKHALRANIEDLRGEFVEQAGPLAALAGQVRMKVGDRLDKEPDENILEMIEEQYSGLSRRQSKLIMDLARKGGEIHTQLKQKGAQAAIALERESFIKEHASWDAVKRRIVDSTTGRIGKALQEAGSDIGRWTAEVSEDVLSRVTGTESYRVTGTDVANMGAAGRRGNLGVLSGDFRGATGGVTPGRGGGLLALGGGLVGGAAGTVVSMGLGTYGGARMGFAAGEWLNETIGGSEQQALASQFGGLERARAVFGGPTEALRSMSVEGRSEIDKQFSRDVSQLGEAELGMGIAREGETGDVGKRLGAMASALAGKGGPLGSLMTGPGAAQNVVELMRRTGASTAYTPDIGAAAKVAGYGGFTGKMTEERRQKDLATFVERLSSKKVLGVSGRELSVSNENQQTLAVLQKGDIGKKILGMLASEDENAIKNLATMTPAQMSKYFGTEVNEGEAATLRVMAERAKREGMDSIRSMTRDLPGLTSIAMSKEGFAQHAAMWGSEKRRFISEFATGEFGKTAEQLISRAAGDEEAFVGTITSQREILEKLLSASGASKESFMKLSGFASSMGLGQMGYAVLSMEERLAKAGGKGKVSAKGFALQMRDILPGASDEMLKKAYTGDTGDLQEALTRRLGEGPEAAAAAAKIAGAASGGYTKEERRAVATELAMAGYKGPATGSGKTGGIGDVFKQADEWSKTLIEHTRLVQGYVMELKGEKGPTKEEG